MPVDIRHEVLDEPQDAPSARVVSTSQFQAKPMSLDEAILQMDLLEQPLLRVPEREDRAINVVYRRDDGKLRRHRGARRASAAP